MMEGKDTSALSAQQRDAFARDGYLVLESVFDADEVQALAAAADRILVDALIAALAFGARYPRLRAQMRDGLLEVNMMQPVGDLADVIGRIAYDERIIGPMRDILDDEPLLMEEKLNYKQAVPVPPKIAAMYADQAEGYFDVDTFFPVHNDWGYYRLHGYPPETLSSAVSIDPTGGRGPLRVVPGSHLRSWEMLRTDPATGDGRIVPGQVIDDDKVEVQMPAGSVMIFHAKLLHDSLRNASGLPRRLLIYSHYPSTAGGEPDRRNGPNRAVSQEFEARYRALVESGAFVPSFALGRL